MDDFSTSKDLVQFIAKLGDLKDEHYRMTLTLSAIVELMIEKELISRQELDHKAAELDKLMNDSTYPTA